MIRRKRLWTIVLGAIRALATGEKKPPTSCQQANATKITHRRGR